MERSFLMIKPDAVQRGLIGKIINRMERKGLRMTALKLIRLDEELANKLYDIHVGKSFFDELVSFVTSGPVVVMVLEGERAIEVVRNLIGATRSFEARPGTLRGDFGLTVTKNIVHASDAPDRADYEIGLFFKEEEILNYQRIDASWIYS